MEAIMAENKEKFKIGQASYSESNLESAYELYLPDKKLLQAKVKEWVNEFEKGK